MIPERSAFARGARHPQAHSDAESARPGERHARQLPGVGRRDLRRGSVRRTRRPSPERLDQHLRSLQQRQVHPRRPDSIRQGGGPYLVSLGGVSDVKNQSLAIGVDKTLSSTLLADFRFGWFEYDVNVLPFDFGTTPAKRCGHSGAERRHDVHVGPAGVLRPDGPGGFNAGSGLGVNQCNCPLAQNEKQWQLVGNLTKLMGNHSFKFGMDVRRAYNLRVPSDNHRSGELSFSSNRTSLNGSGGQGLATFLLGDVTTFNRYVSPNTNARERQWRHFYYAQDTWRATPKLTLNYGLRLDIINPQTVNEAGNGGWLDLNTGEILDRRGRRRQPGRQRQEQPELGAARRRDVSDRREDGHPRRVRAHIRHRRVRLAVRAQRDAEPAGALGAELNPASNFDKVFTLEGRPAGPDSSCTSSNGPFPAPERRVHARAADRSSGHRSVDAFNITVQHQLNDVMSVEVGYVGNRGRHAFVGDGPAVGRQRSDTGRVPGYPARQQKAVLLWPGPNGRWWIRRGLWVDAGHRFLLQLRPELGTTRCRRASIGDSMTATRTR